MRQVNAVMFALALLLVVRDVHADFAKAEWRVRDVAGGGEFVAAAEALATAQLALEPKLANGPQDVWASSCTVIDRSGGERAVTMALCIPLDAVGGTWWDDPQRTRRIEGDKSFVNLSDNCGGVNNQSSLYPMAVLARGDGEATCVATSPDAARLPRFVYDPVKRELRAEFDFGLSPVPQHFPSRADAGVIGFTVPGEWAFRRALDRYYKLYPEAFRRRATSAGIWLPFGETGPIENAADFGFVFHEVADHQAREKRILDDDERIGAGSYVYAEPPTYWQQYTGDGKGTYEQRLAQLEKEAADGNETARATIVSGITRDDGRRDIYLPGVAYTPMRPWGSNADPGITDTDKSRNWPGKGAHEFARLSSVLGWDGGKTLGVDGVYVDSMEGWGEILNYNHDHWRVSKYPLTFDPKTKRVALLNFWGTVEWVKQASERSREHGMLLFGNDAFFRRWQLAPYVDVPGREYTWVDKSGKLTPVEDSRYLFFRAMSAKRPYLMLMNNRFEDGSMMKPYFQRSVFYAVFPSMFIGHQQMNEVAYFSNPDWYNRDRALFKKYVPIVRKLDEAGWEPVPYARVEPSTVRVERYGNAARGDLAFTLHNTAGADQDVSLTLMTKELNVVGDVTARDWIGERDVAVQAGTLRLKLPANGYAAVGVTTPMQRIKVSKDGTGFVFEASGKPFVPWGFNYDRDFKLRLIEEYWDAEWATIAGDFREMRALGANVVRVHLQFAKFMDGPDKANAHALEQLARLLALAEETRLYLDVTGLACYRKADVPAWYSGMSETERWAAQARFWEAVAATCANSPAVFCYDLVNEPIVPEGKLPAGNWLFGELSGFTYCQFITLDPAGRSRPQIARQWIEHLTSAIRKHDPRTPITVGLLPNSVGDGPGTSGFDPKVVAPAMDFTSVHIYPDKSRLRADAESLKGFRVAGKPLVVEEIFPLACEPKQIGEFIELARPTVAGWLGFYWGRTPEELRPSTEKTDVLTRGWLEEFRRLNPNQ